MKSILISIKPKWVAKILNGEKTIEIRKTAPKCELPIDVYIYCTKGAYIGYLSKKYVGKVVAKFTLKKVEEIKFHILTKTNTYGIQRIEATFTAKTLSYTELTKLSCLAGDYLMEYLNDTDGYAWHISDLQLLDNLMKPSGFDNLMELSDFGLKRAPQSWCYVGEDDMTKSELMKYPKKYLVGLLTMERDDAEFKNLMKKKKELIIENYIDVLSVLVEEDQLNV